MSLNTSAPLIPLAPPGTIWVAAVGPALGFLMIAATMGSALVVMLAALFFFSTPNLWKKPVFILNVFSLLVGIAYACIDIYEEFHALLHPTALLNPKLSLAIGGFDGFTPTLIDSILLFRLYAVYPYDRTPRLKFLFIMSIPVMIKIGRIINASLFLNDYANTIAATNNIGGSAAVLLTIRSPFIKVEWSLQILDDVCVFNSYSF
ncbi:uncharacterized protein STEHIDRAFT_57338 [Stereum hirsutum FP-91666 SS1]|uniref:uncharacterized protein n=1 Tax=Stereum hirsutum (strain FP-91666) TaxID=721885 RepID=UPI000440DDBE|nr:uncharacterized protein STEHIDRAFT_57338 [Stereum hirsutum FP-91666 SS1]EIM86423.1 hypothetical protein STEHIDRAFT_57338 [Stereum hirsutum FP-91666 SS1]